MPQNELHVQEISRNELVAKRERGEPFILVNVLGHDQFEHIRLPGSVNVPLPLLRDLAPVLLGTEDQIIVYCANFECNASPTAARILMQLGFTDVLDYTGGVKDWVEGGQPVIHMPHEAEEKAA